MAVYLRPCEMDAVADLVFRTYMSMPDIRAQEYVLRIEPEKLLNRLLGLRIEYCRLDDILPPKEPGEGKTLGLSWLDDSEVTIVYPSGETIFLDATTVLLDRELLGKGQTGRRNFTMVHEGCHHILRMMFPGDREGGRKERRMAVYRQTGARRTREEEQVDRLASRILMPRYLVEQAMFLAGQNGKIEQLDSVACREEYMRFCTMSRMLGVSRTALRIRMQELGLLGTVHCRRPYEFMDIRMEKEDYEREKGA